MFTFGLQNRFGHFLNKERNAITTLHNLLTNVVRKRGDASDSVDHG